MEFSFKTADFPKEVFEATEYLFRENKFITSKIAFYNVESIKVLKEFP